MANLFDKFEKHIDTITSAAHGETDLRVEDQRLLKKLRKYYSKAGVIFTGDDQVDYNILVNYLYDDLLVSN